MNLAVLSGSVGLCQNLYKVLCAFVSGFGENRRLHAI